MVLQAPSFSLYTILLSGFFFLAAFLTHLILIPYLKILTYKAKGYQTYFFPVLGEVMLWMKNYKTKGDIFAETKECSVKFPNQKLLVSNINHNILFLLRDPLYAKEFLANPQLYVKCGATDFLKPVVGYGGLAILEGDQWKRHRKIIANSFHYESLRTNVSVVQKTVKELFDKLPPKDLQNYSAIDNFQEITGEVVGRIFFGEKLNDYTHEGKSLTMSMANLVADVMEASLTPLAIFFGRYAIEYPVFPRFRKLKKQIKSIRNVCFQIIKDRKESKQGGNDLLNSLLETQNLTDPEMRFTDKEIVDEFITFFIAGMDTTGHLVAMVLYDLSQHPEHFQAVEKERKETYNQEKVINVTTLEKMTELHYAMKETMRLHTPAAWPFYRVAIADHRIGDLEVKKGTWIRLEFLALSNSQKHFENAEEYQPGRWKEASAGKVEPYAYTPFSAGPRNCVGQHLAVAETKILVSEFLERFSFKVKDDFKLRMVQRFLYEPDGKMMFELTPK